MKGKVNFMAKKVSRKKQLRNQARRLNKKTGLSAVGKVAEVAEQAVETVEKTVEQTVATVEDFAESLGGLALDRAQTFYDEGIKSIADFANWTEKELLALKGIGPATIKKLQENGVTFK